MIKVLIKKWFLTNINGISRGGNGHSPTEMWRRIQIFCLRCSNLSTKQIENETVVTSVRPVENYTSVLTPHT